MDSKTVLAWADNLLDPGFLNQAQEVVLTRSWEGKTYVQIAIEFNYDADYVKNVGYHLWNKLSSAAGVRVTKSNLRSVVRRSHYSVRNPQVLSGELFVTGLL